MSMSWVADQLRAMRDAAALLPQAVPRFNPRPPGVIRDGSATEVVLAFLYEHPARWFVHHEIMVATGRSRAAVDWALIFLRQHGLVDCVSNSSRNPRYLRYRAAKESQP